MAQYDHEHTNAWNKILHGIGIPVIIAGIVLAIVTFWRTGLALFVGGWILLFAGHRIEGNKPAFFQGVIYFLVGPIWIAKELKEAILGSSRRSTTAPWPLVLGFFDCSALNAPLPISRIRGIRSSGAKGRSYPFAAPPQRRAPP